MTDKSSKECLGLGLLLSGATDQRFVNFCSQLAHKKHKGMEGAHAVLDINLFYSDISQILLELFLQHDSKDKDRG